MNLEYNCDETTADFVLPAFGLFTYRFFQPFNSKLCIFFTLTALGPNFTDIHPRREISAHNLFTFFETKSLKIQ